MSIQTFIHCDQCNCDFSTHDKASWGWVELLWPKETHFCGNECAAKYFAEKAGGAFVKREGGM